MARLSSLMRSQNRLEMRYGIRTQVNNKKKRYLSSSFFIIHRPSHTNTHTHSCQTGRWKQNDKKVIQHQAVRSINFFSSICPGRAKSQRTSQMGPIPQCRRFVLTVWFGTETAWDWTARFISRGKTVLFFFYLFDGLFSFTVGNLTSI